LANEKQRFHTHFIFIGNYYEFVAALYLMCMCLAEHRSLSKETRLL